MFHNLTVPETLELVVPLWNKRWKYHDPISSRRRTWSMRTTWTTFRHCWRQLYWWRYGTRNIIIGRNQLSSQSLIVYKSKTFGKKWLQGWRFGVKIEKFKTSTNQVSWNNIRVKNKSQRSRKKLCFIFTMPPL